MSDQSALAIDHDAAQPRENLTERAYREIEELLVTLQLPPGALISEGQLASRLGISRTPVREALQRLARGGLIRVMPKRGLLVTEIDIQKQLRMLEVRREIERLMARRAARLRTANQVAECRAVADAFAAAGAAGDEDAFTRADRRLNQVLADAAANEFATEAVSQMQGLARRFWYHYQARFADVSGSAQLHRALALAVADGDEQAAAAASDALLDYVDQFTRATLETG